MQGLGAEAIFVHTDVRNENEVRDLVDQAIARFGHLDVAVNCAGTEGKPGPVTEQTAETYAATFDTNVLGTLLSIVQWSERRVIITLSNASRPRSPESARWLGGLASVSVLSKLEGPVNQYVPPFVGLSPKMGHMPWADAGTPGFLGVGHAPFKPSGAGKDDMVLNGITLDRLADRKALLSSFDGFRRDVDSSGLMSGLDSFNEQAFGIMTSSKLMEALDVEKEDRKVRESYGKGDPKNRDDGGPKLMEHFLVARRLVEAGARCVTLAFSRWDHHGDNFGALRQDLPYSIKA